MTGQRQSAVTFLLAALPQLMVAHPDLPPTAVAWTRDPQVLALIGDHRGVLLDGVEGVPFVAAFPDPHDALAAALLLQRTHQAATPTPGEAGRIALHTGPTAGVQGSYFGTTLNRARALFAACV